MTYLCPCLTCPNCGSADDDRNHPCDGLATCHSCAQPTSVIEWWSVSGPYMDGRHMTNWLEEAVWRKADNAVIVQNFARSLA